MLLPKGYRVQRGGDGRFPGAGLGYEGSIWLEGISLEDYMSGEEGKVAAICTSPKPSSLTPGRCAGMISGDSQH